MLLRSTWWDTHGPKLIGRERNQIESVQRGGREVLSHTTSPRLAEAETSRPAWALRWPTAVGYRPSWSLGILSAKYRRRGQLVRPLCAKSRQNFVHRQFFFFNLATLIRFIDKSHETRCEHLRRVVRLTSGWGCAQRVTSAPTTDILSMQTSLLETACSSCDKRSST